MEDKFDYVKAQLAKRLEERQLSKVATGSGVSRRVIAYIMEGRNARTDTVDKLYKYLKDNVRKKVL
jgi:transcriptional regulator with XRE-family HTH domain